MNLNCILFQGLTSSIRKGDSTAKGPFSQGLHKFP